MSRNQAGRDSCLFRSEIASQRYPYIPNNLLLTPSLLHQVPIHPTSDLLFSTHRQHFPLLPPATQNKPNVDRAFLRQLLAILRITFPSYRCSEVGVVLVHSTFLVLRTVLSVGVAKLDGKIVKALVRRHFPSFECNIVPTSTPRLVQMAVASFVASRYGFCSQFPVYTRILWCCSLPTCTVPTEQLTFFYRFDISNPVSLSAFVLA